MSEPLPLQSIAGLSLLAVLCVGMAIRDLVVYLTTPTIKFATAVPPVVARAAPFPHVAEFEPGARAPGSFVPR